MEAEESGFDPRRANVVICLKTQDTLDRAKELLELAINNRSKKVARTLVGSTIIVAMAHMVQEVENRLAGEIAHRILSQGTEPNLKEVKSEIPKEFFPKLEMLLKILSNGHWVLDYKKDATRRLREMSRLRNRLVHDEGMILLGSGEDFTWSHKDGIPELHLPEPKSVWGELCIVHARDSVQYAESYFVELDKIPSDSFLADSLFFNRI